MSFLSNNGSLPAGVDPNTGRVEGTNLIYANGQWYNNQGKVVPGPSSGGGDGDRWGGDTYKPPEPPKLNKDQKELLKAQQKLVKKAYTKPEGLVTKPEFVRQKVKSGELIDRSVGN